MKLKSALLRRKMLRLLLRILKVESAQKINLTKSAMARQKLITMLTEKNRGVDDIACVRPMNSLEQFVQETLLNSTFCNTTIIGHGRKFLSLVYKALLKLNSQPVPIRKSSGLLRLLSTTNNIRFTTIDTYLSKGLSI